MGTNCLILASYKPQLEINHLKKTRNLLPCHCTVVETLKLGFTKVNNDNPIYSSCQTVSTDTQSAYRPKVPCLLAYTLAPHTLALKIWIFFFPSNNHHTPDIAAASRLSVPTRVDDIVACWWSALWVNAPFKWRSSTGNTRLRPTVLQTCPSCRALWGCLCQLLSGTGPLGALLQPVLGSARRLQQYERGQSGGLVFVYDGLVFRVSNLHLF